MTANPLPPIPPISATTGMAPAPGASRFKPVDPLKVVRQYAWVLVAAGAAGLVLGVILWAALRHYAPEYTSEAYLRVISTPSNPWDSSGQQFVNSGGNGKESFMQSEAMVITSDEVLRQAIDNPLVQQTTWFAEQGRDARTAREALRKEAMTVTPRRGSDLIKLSVSTREAADANRILEAVTQVYLGNLRAEAQRNFAGVSTVYIAERARAMDDIQRINQQIQNFTSENQLTALVASQSDANIAYQNLASQRVNLGLMLDQATEIRAGLEAKAAAGQVEASPEMLQSMESMPTVLQITYQINSLKQRINSYTVQYGANHRFTQVAEADLEAAEQRKAQEIDRLVRDAQVAQLEQARKAVESLQSRIAAVQEKLDTASARLTDLNIKLAEHQRLQAELETAKDMRDRAEASLRDVRMLIDRPDAIPVQLQSSPSQPRLTFPRLLVMAPGMTLLMLGLVGGVVFLKELLDQRVKSPADIKLLPDAELLGVLPDASEDPSSAGVVEGVVAKHPTGLMAESFRQVRTAILAKMDRRGYKTVMVVGGQPQAGASSIVQNLATSLAYNGRSVAIVDANFRRPSQHRLAGIGNDLGLIDVLNDRATLDKALVRLDGQDIWTLPAGHAEHAAPELFEAATFRSLLSQLESKFDLVLIDAPPALLASESLLLAKHVDAMAIVVRAATDKRGMVERMLRRLDGQRADVLGVILSGVRSSAGGYFRKNYREFYRYGKENPADGRAAAGNGQANGSHRAAAGASAGNGAGNGTGRHDASRQTADVDVDVDE